MQVYGTTIFKINSNKMLFFENGLEMEFKTYLATINPFQHYNGGITMKTFKNNFVARRLWAFALVFAFAIGMFGNTTAFAAEAQDLPLASNVNEAVTPRVTSVLFSSTHGYVKGNFTLANRCNIERPSSSSGDYRMFTIAYSFEDNHDTKHPATLVFRSEDHTTSIHLNDTTKNGIGYDSVQLYYNKPYKVIIYPGCTSEYMASVSVYY